MILKLSDLQSESERLTLETAINFLPLQLRTSRLEVWSSIVLPRLSCYIIQAGEHTTGDAQGDPDNSQVLEDELDIISEDSNIKPKFTNQTKESSGSLLLGLDQAILKSIEACPTEEMKKKMYTTVLIVGSGFKFRHVEKFLTQKLALQVSQFCWKFEFHFKRYCIRLIKPSQNKTGRQFFQLHQKWSRH